MTRHTQNRQEYVVNPHRPFVLLLLSLFVFCVASPVSAHDLTYLTDGEVEWLKAHPVVTIAPDPYFPPIEFFDKEANYRGIGADYVSELEARLGITFRVIRCTTWDEALEKTRNREIDALPAAGQTPERERYLTFSDPHIELPGVIISRKMVRGTLTMDSLKGMHVSVVKSYIWHELIPRDHPAVMLDPVPNVETGLKKVSMGMSDAMIVILPAALYYIEQQGITNLRVAGDTEYVTRLSFATRNDWPLFNSIIRKTLHQIHPDAKQAILRHWIQLEQHSLFSLKKFWLILVIALGAGGTLAIGILVWNFLLRRRVNQRTAELNRELDERRQAEAALRESETKYRYLVERINDVIYATDAAGTITYVSPAIEFLTGYRIDEVRGRNFVDFVHEDDRPQIANRFDRLVAGDTRPEEYRMIDKSGRLFWVRTHSQPLFEDNRFLGIQGVLSNITIQKEAEIALAKNEEKYRTILETMQEGYFEVDLKGNFTFFNDAMCRMSGHSRDELLGMNNRNYTTPETSRKLYRVFHDIFRTGEPGELVDYEIITRGGSIRIGELTASLMRDESGTPIGFRGMARDVTERKQSEKEIKERRLYLERVLASAPDAVVTLDDRNHIVEWNRGAERLFGYAPDEVTGKNLDDFITNPVCTGEATAYAEQVLGGQELAPVESVRYRKDGTAVPVIIAASPIVADGHLLGAIAIYSDVTNIKRVEEAFRESEERFRSIVEHSHEGILIVDDAYRLTYVNDELCRIVGYEREEILGHDFRDFLDDESRELVANRYVQRQQGKAQPPRYGFNILRKDGTKRRMEISSSVGRFASGQLQTVAQLLDITERKEAEEALRKSEEKYRSILSNMEECYFELDLAGRFTFFNNAVCKLAQLPPDELMGMNNREYTDEETSAKMFTIFSEIYRTGRPAEITDYEIILRDGSRRTLELSTALMKDDEGNPTGFRGVARDVTARKKADQQLKRSLREKEVMLQEIHHRVKNNLQIVSSMLSLQSNYVADEQALALFKDSENRVKSMALIHEKLYQSESLAEIDFSEYVKSLTSRLFQMYGLDGTRVSLVSRIHNIFFEIEAAIPCGLIISELVSNALKHAFPDNRGGEISITLQCDMQQSCMLQVRDNGIGMGKEIDWNNIGTLGLQLVADLTAQLEGTIDVDRCDGIAFTIRFKRKSYRQRL